MSFVDCWERRVVLTYSFDIDELTSEIMYLNNVELKYKKYCLRWFQMDTQDSYPKQERILH